MSTITAPLALPKDSLVLVTGANGYQGSHVVDQLLKNGYRVRGTVRDSIKAAWTTDFFSKRYGAGKYEALIVPDMLAPHAHDEAVKDVNGIIHIAAPTTMSPDPALSIPGAKAGVLSILASAAAAAAATATNISPNTSNSNGQSNGTSNNKDQSNGIKRFVLCSSVSAATPPRPGEYFTTSTQDWNTQSEAQAWATPKEQWGPEQVFTVILAMKTAEEMEARRWVEREKPGFVFNAVLPSALLGRLFSPQQGYPTTAGFLKTIYEGDMSIPLMAPAQWYVDVADSAALHVAALIYSDVEDERVFGVAEPISWSTIPGYIKKAVPGWDRAEDDTSQPVDLSTWTGRPRAEELLRRVKGSGWTTLEESVKALCESFV